MRKKKPFRLIALDGGNRVGASCYVIQFISGRNGKLKTIVVDCGLRFTDNRMTVGPDFSPLDGVHVDAIVITHAHLDHIGALPRLFALHPEAKVYMTRPTSFIGAEVLMDAMKIAERRQIITPNFTRLEMETLFNSDNVFLADEPAIPDLTDDTSSFEITFWPSGHIRGAASPLIRIYTPEGHINIMFSGDISFHRTASIGGAVVPPGLMIDVLITEATNGSRDLPDYDHELTRFVRTAMDVQMRGGNVLAPSFAIGRGGDVVAELAECGVETHVVGGFLKRMLVGFNRWRWCDLDYRIKLRGNENIIFERGSEDNLGEIADKQGQVVVATSGMLDVGPSNFLAHRWLENPRNAVLFTGFTADDSMGRALINLRQGSVARFPDRNPSEIICRAEVHEFHLSAHADGRALARHIKKLNPGYVVGVHCDKTGFAGLTERLRKCGFNAPMQLAENGKWIELN